MSEVRRLLISRPSVQARVRPPQKREKQNNPNPLASEVPEERSDLSLAQQGRAHSRTLARFLSHVDTSGGPDACHPWTACLDRDGYGLFGLLDGSCVRAHRFALSLKLGRPLDPAEVCRHAAVCTTRACCNDRHLSPGSIADNNRDTVAAGRQSRGERHGSARLSPADVAAILAQPTRRAKDLAAAFAVSDRQIYHLRNGKRWRHVTAAAAVQS